MSIFIDQGSYKPIQELPTGKGDSFRDVQKFTMGAGSSRLEMNIKDGLWMGADTFATAPFRVDFNGLVTANNLNVNGGTITGATIQTATTGYRVRMANTNKVEFLLDNTSKGSIYADTGDTLIIGTAANVQFFAGASSLGIFNTTGLTMPSTKKIAFSGGASILDGGAYLKIEGAAGGICDLQVEGNVYPNSDNSRQCGTADKRWQDMNAEDIHVDDLFIGASGSITVDGNSGDSFSHDIITSIFWDGGTLKARRRTYTFTKGVCTSQSSETTFTP